MIYLSQSQARMLGSARPSPTMGQDRVSGFGLLRSARPLLMIGLLMGATAPPGWAARPPDRLPACP
eukprot:3837109-Alexandrium_andersonii.AAC.1